MIESERSLVHNSQTGSEITKTLVWVLHRPISFRDPKRSVHVYGPQVTNSMRENSDLVLIYLIKLCLPIPFVVSNTPDSESVCYV